MHKVLLLSLLFPFSVFSQETSETIIGRTEPDVIYEVSSPIESSTTLMFGISKPTQVGASSAAGNYSQVYGSSSMFIDFAMEFHMLDLLGPLSIRGGISILFDKGDGTLIAPDGTVQGTTSLENFYFFGFPLAAGANYMFYFSRYQYVYPYAHADLVYLPFFEVRSDGKKFHYGGNFNIQFAAGVRILIDWAEPKPAFRLDRDFGVNNTYIQIEYRRFQSITAKTMKFDANIFLFGVSFDI